MVQTNDFQKVASSRRLTWYSWPPFANPLTPALFFFFFSLKGNQNPRRLSFGCYVGKFQTNCQKLCRMTFLLNLGKNFDISFGACAQNNILAYTRTGLVFLHISDALFFSLLPHFLFPTNRRTYLFLLNCFARSFRCSISEGWSPAPPYENSSRFS